MSDSQDKLENGTFLDRLKVERDELAQKTTKLKEFINTPTFHQLSGEDLIDLRLQLPLMERYLDILVRRINRIVANH